MVVIEDDPKNMKLFKAIIQSIQDVKIYGETRGDRGLILIKKVKPDLIILDIRLPKLDGIEICKQLRRLEDFRETPILAVTAFAMKGDKERILKAGFDEYISKPIKVSEFKKKVRYHLKV